MPKKRNNSRFHNKKQKQIITSRLIEISLKVEDYVYNQKPISETEAKQYINEVVSFKALCFQDERSLQVIEKLTRCMNSIINEYRELRGDTRNRIDGSSFPNNDITPRSISPVYSLCDEDRTQFTQITEENAKNITQANNEIDIVDCCVNDDDNLDSTTKTANPTINVEVDIHRAISNLSLREVEDPHYTDIFSQSILNNFNEIEKNQQLEATVTSDIPITTNKFVYYNINIENTLRNETVLQNSETTKTAKITDNIKRNISNQNNVNQYCTEDLTVDTNQSNAVNTAKPKLHDPEYCTQLIKNYNIVPVKKSAARLPLKESNKLKNERNAINSNKSTKSKINNDVINNTEAVVNENSESANKKKRRRKKTGADTEKETKNINITKKRQTTKRPKGFANLNKAVHVPIYNKNVENDLSWLENIRYVREIRADENDPNMNLEESFWDNYYLPANWNENDFL